MKRMKTIIGLAAITVLALCAMPAFADPFTFNLTAGGDFGAAGNKGLSISAGPKDGITLTLTALTMVPDGVDNIYPSTSDTAVAGGPSSTTKGFYGTVYIDSLGAGVNGWKEDKGNFISPLTIQGSAGISGSGRHEDEALILTFSGAVSLAGAKIYFNDYEITGKDGKDDDSALIYIGSGVAEGATPRLYTSTIEDNLVLVSGSLYYLALDDSDLIWVGGPAPSSFTQIIVRNDGGTGDEGKEFFVSSIQGSPVPEPTTLLLVGFGLVGLVAIKKRFER